MEEFSPVSIEPVKRPPVIMVFAILTFIWGGISLIASLGFMSPNPEWDFQFPMWIGMGTFFLTAGKVVGAAFMIPMKKIGFWFYTGCEVGLIGIWFAAIGPMKEFFNYLGDIGYDGKTDDWFKTAEAAYMFPVLLLPFSIAWIAVYGAQSSKMK